MPEFAQFIADWVASVDLSAISAPAIHEAKRRVIDSVGVAFAAFQAPPARAARALCAEVQALRGATAFGSRNRSTADLATFHNGVLVRYLDYNDTYLSREPAHPSDNIPAALAAAELSGATGAEVLGAITLGYEIQCRLCDAASLRVQGWDHVVYGAMSTALLAGKLLGLTAEQLRHALAIATTSSIALRQTRSGELSMWKGCAFAGAARNGVFAAQLAAEGVTGPWQLFEGEFGIWRQVIPSFSLPPFGGQDGTEWMINKTYIKYWPVEYHAQSAVDAALQLRRNISAGEVLSLRIESFDAAVDIIGKDPEKFRPQSRETADHSLPYCVAVALVAGEVTAEHFEQGWLRDPRVLRLLDCITIERDAELTAGYPDGIPNRLTITLRDGREHVVEVRYPQGHARNPLSDEQVEAKFARVTATTPIAQRRRDILDACWQLDRAASVAPLLNALVVEDQ